MARRCNQLVDIVAGFKSLPLDYMKFIWRQRLGPDHCPYIERWVFETKLFSIRLHHWFKSDDLRHPHDHAWNFVTIVLKGTITDRAYGKDDFRKRFSIRRYSAEHQHSVVVDKPAWTLLFTGPEIRTWGFWVNGKFRKRNKYFFEHGEHDPCGLET